MTTRIGVAACLSAIVLCSVAQLSAGSAGTEKVKKRKGMEMPSQLATGSLEMKVTNRKHFMLPSQPVPLLLEFGSFQVVDFERGWTRTSGTGAEPTHLTVVSGDARQGYHFRLVSTATPEEPPWSCGCAAVGSASTLKRSTERSEIRIPLSAQGRLYCTLDRGDGSEPWQIDVDYGIVAGLITAYHATGSLVSGESGVTIRGTDRLAQYPKIGVQRLTGFVLYLGDDPVGAVDLIKPTVLIGPGLPDELRGPITAASAALLLFEDLTQRLDEP